MPKIIIEEKQWEPMSKGEEMILREVLWLSHGCSFSSLYGDDGEMQCNHCMIDFKRMEPSKILSIRKNVVFNDLKKK